MAGETIMKKAFTMIELIFVIVVIGILASIAVLKLVATRDDAKISACAQDIAIFILDMNTYYTARGDFIDPKLGTVNLEIITNVYFVGSTSIDPDGDNGNFQYACDDASKPAVTFVTQLIDDVANSGEKFIRMTATTTGGNSVDDGLEDLLTQKNLAAPAPGIDHFIGGMRAKR